MDLQKIKEEIKFNKQVDLFYKVKPLSPYNFFSMDIIEEHCRSASISLIYLVHFCILEEGDRIEYLL